MAAPVWHPDGNTFFEFADPFVMFGANRPDAALDRALAAAGAGVYQATCAGCHAPGSARLGKVDGIAKLTGAERYGADGVPAAALWLTNIIVQLFVISTYWSRDAFGLMLNLTSSMALVPFLLVAGRIDWLGPPALGGVLPRDADQGPRRRSPPAAPPKPSRSSSARSSTPTRSPSSTTSPPTASGWSPARRPASAPSSSGGSS